MTKYVVERSFGSICSKHFFDGLDEANGFASSEWDFLGEPERERYRIQVLAVERTPSCVGAENIDREDWYRWYNGAFIPEGAVSFGFKE